MCGQHTWLWKKLLWQMRYLNNMRKLLWFQQRLNQCKLMKLCWLCRHILMMLWQQKRYLHILSERQLGLHLPAQKLTYYNKVLCHYLYLLRQ